MNTGTLTKIARHIRSQPDGKLVRARGSELTEEHGLEYLGDGSGRIVYALPDREQVVKFGFQTSLGDGRDQNETESVIWKALEETYSPYRSVAAITPRQRFVPTLDSGPSHIWVTQPRVQMVTEDPDKDVEAAVEAMLRSFPEINPQSEFCVEHDLCWLDCYRTVDYGSYIPQAFVGNYLPPEAGEKLSEDQIV